MIITKLIKVDNLWYIEESMNSKKYLRGGYSSRYQIADLRRREELFFI